MAYPGKGTFNLNHTKKKKGRKRNMGSSGAWHTQTLPGGLGGSKPTPASLGESSCTITLSGIPALIQYSLHMSPLFPQQITQTESQTLRGKNQMGHSCPRKPRNLTISSRCAPLCCALHGGHREPMTAWYTRFAEWACVSGGWAAAQTS